MADTERHIDLYVFAALTSLLLSAVAFALGMTPNDDAFVYLRTAELAVNEGLRAAFAHYAWAAYPLVIAGLQCLPGVDFFLAAQLLNAALYVLTTLSFMAIIQHIGNTRRLLTLAAMVILAYPHINEFRFHLIRDIGMLGFTLLAMLQLLRFQASQRLAQAAGFCLATLAAALFRGEALLFLALTPLALLIARERPWQLRLRALLTVYALAGALALSAVVGLQLAGINMLTQLQANAAVYLPFLQQVLASLRTADPALSAVLFSEHAAQFSAHHLPLIVSVGMSAILVATIIESLGLIVLMTLVYGAWRSFRGLPPEVRHVLAAYLLVALLIMLVFVLITRFTTTRYTMVFCTVLLLLLPFIIDRAWRQSVQKKRLRSFAAISLLLFTYSVMDAHISYGEPRAHSALAMDWVRENASDAPLMTNKAFIAWLSGRISEFDRVEHDLQADDFLSAAPGTILLIERDEALYERLMAAHADGALILRYQIDDRRGPRILIFERPQDLAEGQSNHGIDLEDSLRLLGHQHILHNQILQI